MAEPELAFTRRTFDDLFGRHALVHYEGGRLPASNAIDVNHLLPTSNRAFHPTRKPDDYQPRHAAVEYTDHQED